MIPALTSYWRTKSYAQFNATSFIATKLLYLQCEDPESKRLSIGVLQLVYILHAEHYQRMQSKSHSVKHSARQFCIWTNAVVSYAYMHCIWHITLSLTDSQTSEFNHSLTITRIKHQYTLTHSSINLKSHVSNATINRGRKRKCSILSFSINFQLWSTFLTHGHIWARSCNIDIRINTN